MLLFIFAQMWSITSYKEEPLQVFFADTTNEFGCARKYRLSYIEWVEKQFDIKIEYHEEKAESNYFDVVDEIGLPFISKKVSRMVRDCKATLKRLGMRYADIEQYMPSHYGPTHFEEMVTAANKLREMGFNDTVILNLTKITSGNKIGKRFLPIKYRPILDSDEIVLSEKCCDILKKRQ